MHPGKVDDVTWRGLSSPDFFKSTKKKGCPFTAPFIKDAEPMGVAGGEREVESLEERKRKEKKGLISAFSFEEVCAAIVQSVPSQLHIMSPCPEGQTGFGAFCFFHFFPPLLFFFSSLPRCLASGTGSEALIWLPVRQQPFNNNAIVPHSS